MGGYAILQPRVTPSLPVGREGSFYQRLFSGPGGIDPYAAAVSDVYQDLFGEGSYTGKGIYDVDAFEAALAGRVPDNAMLSHDLFEGIFARAGPGLRRRGGRGVPVALRRRRQAPASLDARRLAAASLDLRHRHGGAAPCRRSAAGRCSTTCGARCWRRSRLATLGPVLGCCRCLRRQRGGLLVLAAIAIPAFLPPLFAVLPRRAGMRLRSHLRTLAADLRLAALQTFFRSPSCPTRPGAWRTPSCVRWCGCSSRAGTCWNGRPPRSPAAGPRLDVGGFYRADGRRHGARRWP